ncbi:unnamed protein product [Soboliphyme baturini]|uniref:t-SNARE coiled-coil homology domain-containing protein n=1 Tax=Soboliphyme baturini TaxID=241478 RepID=A0A183IVA2_9BILA|nr:unnamed protein product [Soboliphyme baturini]
MQDENLQKIGNSVHVLKNISQKIGNELDEQAVALDDLDQEMTNTHLRLNNVMKKLAQAAHISTGKRQCYAILVLVLLLLIIIILFIVL